MKKVLVLSYFFLPSDAIAARRTKSYMDHLPKHGYKCTLITSEFPSDVENGIIEENYAENAKVIRIAPSASKKGELKRFLYKNLIGRKLHILYSWFQGFFDSDSSNDDIYVNFKKYLKQHLKNEQYDVTIAIYNPHFCLRLAYEMKQEFGIPYILDFRDLWANHLINHTPIKLNFQDQVFDFFVKRYWSKWIKNSNAYSITSVEWMSFLQNMSDRKGEVITNGFEDEFLTIQMPKTSYFSIGYMGALYNEQNIDLFLEAFCDFLKLESVDSNHVKLELMGVKEFYREGVLDVFRKKIPLKNLEIHPSTSYVNALKFCKSMSITWYPGFSNISGWVSAKIYDFISSGTPILLAPSDNGSVEETLKPLNNIFIGNDKSEILTQLKYLYSQWQKDELENTIDFNSPHLRQFKRSYQAERMAKLLDDCIK